MRMRKGSLVAAVVTLLVVTRQSGARPQGSLPVADIIPTEGVTIHPRDEVKLHDLTTDTLNEVNAALPTLGSRRSNVLTDDVTFQFPGGSSGSGYSSPLTSPSTDDVVFSLPGTGISATTSTIDDVQFTFPSPPASGADLSLDLSGSKGLGVGLPSIPDEGAAGGRDLTYDSGSSNFRGVSSSKFDVGGDFGGNFDQFGGGSGGQFGGTAGGQFGGNVADQFGANAADQFGGGAGGQFGGGAGGQFGGNAADQFGGGAGGQFGGSAGGQFGGNAADQFGGSAGGQFGGDAANQFGGSAGGQFGGNAADQFGGVTGSQFGGDAADQFGGGVGGQFGGGVGGQFGGNAADQFGGVTGGQFGGDAADQFGGSAGGQFGGNAADQFGGGAGGQFGGNAADQFGRGAGGQFGGGAGGQFGGGAGGQFGGNTADQFGGSTSTQLGSGGDFGQFGGSTGQFGGSTGQFGGSAADQIGGGDYSQFDGTGADQLGEGILSTAVGDKGLSQSIDAIPSDLNIKIPHQQGNLPDRTIGDGNRKVFNHRHSQDDLLSLLLPGRNTYQSSSGGNPIGDLLSAGAGPLKKVFNFLTLGVFDNNNPGSNPLKDILAPLTLGLLGGERQPGLPGLDLSAIGLGQETIGELIHAASSGIDDLARETSAGLRLAQDEVRFQANEKVRQFIDSLQQTGRTAGVIGQNTYRALLQKKDALGKLLVGVVTNLGRYINTSVGNTFDKVSGTANVLGKFINDVKVGLLNSMIAKGENVRELVSGTLGTVGTAFKDFTHAAQSAAEDNIRAITGLKDKKFR